MRTKTITDQEIERLKVASLPTRPTAPTALGGRGYSARDMKEAFDKLPLFIIERLNQLISDLTLEGEDGVAGVIPTGICEDFSLYDLFSEIGDGRILSRIPVGEESLALKICEIERRLCLLEDSKIEETKGQIDTQSSLGGDKD